VSLVFRRSIACGCGTRLNVSKRGASVSCHVRDRVTVNSRGRVSIRLAPGLSWRLGSRRR
jgi:hypothetical protein